MIGSLVIARGCFHEVSCDGTSFTAWLVTLLIGGFHGKFCDGTVQCSALTRGCYRSPRIIWDPGIIHRFSWFSLIDCGLELALLEDKQSLAREDCNVSFLIKGNNRGLMALGVERYINSVLLSHQCSKKSV